ncbi:MFS transporter [Bacillaceae bacterium Marseille-Q3522]|nr:MFS transporter [Bacillaceae bacterium Marseille-Q3522]
MNHPLIHTKKRTHTKWTIISISLIPLVMTLGNSMLIPVLPVMEQHITISSFQSSMIITVYSMVSIPLIPIAGFLSDHIGRKKVIIPSLFVAAAGGFVCGWAAWKMQDPYWVILIGRSLQGVGAAGAAPIVMPLVGDLFQTDEEISKNLGIIETANTFGKVLSPILGAFLAGFFWYLPFYAIPVFCVISIFFMFFQVRTLEKETKEPVPFKKFLQNVQKIFRKNGDWLYAIFFTGAVLMFSLFSVLFYLSDVLEKTYQIVNLNKGLLLAFPLGALCLSSYLAGKKIKENKKLMKWMIFVSLLFISVSIVLLSFSVQLFFMISMFFFSGIGIGLSLPCLDAFITEEIETEERGTITAFYHSMRFIGVALGPPITAIIMNQSEKGIFYLLCGLSAFSAIIALFKIRPESKQTAK